MPPASPRTAFGTVLHRLHSPHTVQPSTRSSHCTVHPDTRSLREKIGQILWTGLWIVLSIIPAIVRLFRILPDFARCGGPTSHATQPYMGIFFVISGFVSLCFSASRAVKQSIAVNYKKAKLEEAEPDAVPENATTIDMAK